MEDEGGGFDRMIAKDEQAEIVGQLFMCFLEQYTSDGVNYEYMEQIRIMRRTYRTSLYVDWQQISEFNIELATEIEQEYYRYEPILKSTVEVVYHRTLLEGQSKSIGAQLSEFWVHFYNLPLVFKLRELRSNHIGKLRAFGGTVTRTSEVRPELLFAVFVCLDCGKVQLPVEQHFCYTEPQRCIDQTCANSTRWQLEMPNSTFVDWQKIHVQENPNEIPSGSMPRHIDVVLRQDAVEQTRAGDRCTFIGTLMVVPDVSVFKSLSGSVMAVQGHENDQTMPESGVSGLKSIGVRELTYKLIFVASTVATPGGMLNLPEVDEGELQLEDEEKELIFSMKNHPDIYRLLSRSIAPTIFGHEEVKKGLLLMLFGGIQKETPEGTRLRGDINVCIIGDPSVAKSQFLKYILGLVPRTVYTSGKASTAAGLTATVVRDPDTNDYNIEAGALMLADSGICCIDEFDKMEYTDQVAIHEAMEQQTISIAKAGIHATLNARTSILAAANPIGGRYDKSRSLKSNITITPAIMSRFDLLFVILDKNDVDIDGKIARHIIMLHQDREQDIAPKYTQKDIQTYLKFARTIKPQFTPEAAAKLVQEYCALRISDQGKGKTVWRITVRQLESIIRLSEALARVHLEDHIGVLFVEEAVRLLRQSIISICSNDVEIEANFTLERINKDNLESTIDKDVGKEIRDEESVKTAPKTRVKTTISREEYERIKNIIILHVQRNSELNPQNKTFLQDDIVKWYLEECSDRIRGHEDIKYQKALANSIINRIITSEKLLHIVKDSGQKGQRMLALKENIDFDNLY